MGNDDGIVGHLSNGQHRADDVGMIDPPGRHHALGRDDHFVFKEPKADSLSQHEDYQRYGNMYHHGAAEGVGQFLLVIPAQLKCQETARRTAHRCLEKSHHRDDASHSRLNTIVLNTQDVQDDARGIEPHGHRDKHPEVERYRILSHTLTADDRLGRLLSLLNGLTVNFLLERTFRFGHMGRRLVRFFILCI